MKNLKRLLVVMPCYNEEDVLETTIKKMSTLMEKWIEKKKISPLSQVCFVNDGSKDKTWDIISKIASKNKLFCGVNLSRNFGHQGALLAGLYENEADVYVTIDVDLQDDPACIEEMLSFVEEGKDIVYGVRQSRRTDTFFKRFSAQLFYKFLKILGVNIVYNHADFRMMTKRAVDVLKQFPERNLFLRAIVPLVGFDDAKVYYDRSERLAGVTKYPLKKMLAFAWNGISNFSIVPLRVVTLLGFLFCFLGFCFILMVVYGWWMKGTIAGWASTITTITALGGIQLLSLGIIGEYLAKVFIEVKQRPLFIVKEKTPSK
ncbi:MAG: glycosyltransferase family 2 protein [Alphaproteobacteria bacterium]|nr:glycosyltransferase family 2 protein [Alphaproteobacteria bacterium]